MFNVPSLLRSRAYLWPCLMILAIFAASSASRLAAPNLGVTFSIDKVAHFSVFGLLATSILRTPRLNTATWKSALIAAALTSLYGICDEFHQSFTPGRDVELADWMADTLGALLAVTVYLKWHRYRKLLEWRVARSKRANNTRD